MAWIRLEDTFPEHTKIDAAGGDAAWLHVCGIGYCNRNRTDGFIPTERVHRLSDRKNPMRLAERLVLCGLWEIDPRGGWLIHDYLDYNPTKAELDQADSDRYVKKSEAGKLGGIASGIARRKHSTKQTGSINEANEEPNGNQNEAPSRPVPTRPDLKLASSENSSSAATGRDRRSEAIERYAAIGWEQANQSKINDQPAFMAALRKQAAAMPDLDVWLTEYPEASGTQIGAWLSGDKHSMRYQTRGAS